jgi:hypothetical protein
MAMEPAPALRFHNDDELCAVLGSPITERAAIHESPLSRVERVTCASGETHIYKVQSPPSVEPEFYQRATSPIVVKSSVLPLADSLPALVLEDVRAPHLCQLTLPAVHATTFVEQMLERIASIGGDLPALRDIRTPALWDAYANEVRENVHALVASGAQGYSTDFARHVDERSRSPDLYKVFDGPMGYVHDDLLDTNILVLSDGFRVLDWQRPVWGPIGLDRATLFEAVGQDPRPHVLPGVLLMRWVMRTGHFAAFARRGIPYFYRSKTRSRMTPHS